MKYLEEVAEKLLSPSTDLMDRSVILEDCFDCAAIAEPKELCAPKKFAVLTNGPAPTAGFANKRMEVALTFGAAAGAKADRSKTGTVHSEIEDAAALRAKDSKGSCGGLGGIRLH